MERSRILFEFDGKSDSSFKWTGYDDLLEMFEAHVRSFETPSTIRRQTQPVATPRSSGLCELFLKTPHGGQVS